MAMVEPHPHDAGKFQSTFDDYAHGPGNGKSRNGVYKHAKRLKAQGQFPGQDSIVQESSENETSSERDTESLSNDTKSESADFVQDVSDDDAPDGTEWGSIAWAEDDPDEGEVRTRTIPKPLGDLATGKQTEASLETTAQFVRYGYMALDRVVTHWGRGVMADPDYTLQRTPADYDALEASTVAVMQHYGISLPISPVLVLGVTVGAAYGPPVVHIQRNADPNRKRGGIRRFFGRFVPSFIRGRKRKSAQNQDSEGEQNDPPS